MFTRIAVWVVVLLILALAAHIRVQRFRMAGHIQPGAAFLQVIWRVFCVPVGRIIWAGAYEMLRTAARGQRQKPPLKAFVLAWITQRAQRVQKLVTVKNPGGSHGSYL